jgi:hypothetical protein
MNKILESIIFTGLFLVAFTTACNLAVSPSDTSTPAPTASLTETPTPEATPTESVPTASATPEFAPLCAADTAGVLPPAQCQVPPAEESSTFCSEKKPYNLILFDQGLTYEVLTAGFRCTDAGVKNEQQMITCTGPMASSFAINICDPSCVIPTVQAAITQCPQDYNFDNVRGCCTQEPLQINQNCTATNFRTSTCVSNCSKIVRRFNCLKNSYACVWNYQEKACEPRK